MDNYNVYVTEINKIFNIFDILEKESQNEDNNNYIDNLKQSKDTILEFAEMIKNTKINTNTQLGEK